MKLILREGPIQYKMWLQRNRIPDLSLVKRTPDKLRNIRRANESRDSISENICTSLFCLLLTPREDLQSTRLFPKAKISSSVADT